MPPGPARSAVPGGALPSAAPSWRLFSSAAGRFSVRLPGVPTFKAIPLPSVPETLQQFVFETEDTFYLIQYADRSAKLVQMVGAEKILLLADNAFLKEHHAAPAGRRLLHLGGYLGHEVIIIRDDGKRETQQAYLVGTRRYTLVTIQPRDQAGRQSPDADKFFSSFTLLSPGDYGKDAPYGKLK